MHSNKEIEVKLILTEQKYNQIHTWAQEHTQFIETQKQTDTYFERSTAPCRYTTATGIIEVDPCLLRLRTIDNGPSYLTSKIKTFDPITNRISNLDEYETAVTDGRMMRLILESIGYQAFATIHKKRIIYQTGPFEISFDDVRDLGLFVEIELKEHGINNHDGITKIHRFIQQLRLGEYHTSTRGYLNMMLNPGHNFKSLCKHSL